VLEKAPEAQEGGNSRVSGQALWIAHPEQLDAVLAYQRQLNAPNPTPEAVLQTWAQALVQLEPWIKANAEQVGMQYTRGMGWTTLDTIVEFPELGAEAAVAYNATIQPNPSGVWRCFREQLRRRPAVEVRYETPLQALVQDAAGAVIGILAGGKRIGVRRGVVMACGGYEANLQMHRDYWGADHIYALGTPHNSGDGIRMVQKAGARLWHMRNFTQSSGNWPAIKTPQFHSAFLRAVVMPEHGWFEIGADHKRFYDEGYHHRLRHYHQMEHGRWQDAPHWRAQPVHMILDAQTLKAGPIVTSLMTWNTVAGGYVWSQDNSAELAAGWIQQANSIGALAAIMQRPVEAVDAAIADFNAVASGQTPCPFGRAAESLRPLSGPPYFCVEISPGIVCSTGGPARDERARVLDHDNQPISGLFAAGEFGSTFANLYQNGAFLTEAMIFGRIAGRGAAERR
jgi:succinate dehydrogenase/fumarate reductase flavoprotein subunit